MKKIMSVPLEKTDKLLKEFFIKDGGLTSVGSKRRSTLLACKDDYKFLRGNDFYSRELDLKKEQISFLSSRIPSFAAILVYCSSVDLLARIMKRDAPKNKSREYFLWSAKRWFGHSTAQSLALWEMRCAMSHQYKIEVGQRAIQSGFNGSMRYSKKDKKWEFNLNGMLGNIRHATEKSYEYINKKNIKTKNKYSEFIYEHGFFYTQ